MAQHELDTAGPPPLSPAEERAILAEQQITEEQAIDEASRIRFQGHPTSCQCVKCASALLSAVTGKRVTIGAVLERNARVQRMLDESHERGAA